MICDYINCRPKRNAVWLISWLFFVGSTATTAEDPTLKKDSAAMAPESEAQANVDAVFDAVRHGDRAAIDSALTVAAAANRQAAIAQHALELLIGAQNRNDAKDIVYVLKQLNPDVVEALPDAKVDLVVPVLIQLLDHNNVEQLLYDTACTLSRFKSRARSAEEALLRLSEDQRPLVKSSALSSLAWVAPNSASFRQRLRAELDNPDILVQIAVLSSLTLSRAAPDIAVPAAIELLKHETALVRRNAILALQIYGPSAIEAVGPLIRVADADLDSQVKSQADEALLQIDPGAVDVVRGLLRSIKGGRSDVMEIALSRVIQARAESAATFALMDLIRTADELSIKRKAIGHLQRIGPLARAAIPLLRELTMIRELKAYAILALVKVAPEEIQTRLNDLAEAMTADNPLDIRIVAAGVLAKSGGGHTDRAVTVLATIANDRSNAGSWVAAIALANAAPARAEPVVAVLIGVISDHDPNRHNNRLNAIGAVAAIGHHASGSVPALLNALHDEAPSIRVQSAWALGKIGTNGVTVIPELQSVLMSDQNPEVRRFAAQSIGNFGPSAAGAIESLKMALGRPNEHPSVLAAIVTAVGKVGPSGAVESLANLIGHSDSDVRREVFYALNELGPGARDAVSELIKALQGSNASNAAATLSRIGTEASSAIPALIEVLDKGDSFYSRRSAADALSRVYQGDDRVIAALTRGLKDQDPRVVTTAAYSLGWIGEDAHTSVDSLITVLQDDAQKHQSDSAREAAIYALGRIGIISNKAIDSLTTLLNSTDVNFQRRAAAALGDIGIPAVSAIPKLRDVAKSPDRIVCQNSIIALGKIGSTQKLTVLLLNGMLGNKERQIRISAAIAVGRQAEEAQARDLVPDLKASQTILQDGISAGRIPGEIDSVVKAKTRLDEAIKRLSLPTLKERTLSWLAAKPWRWGGLAYITVALSLCLGLLFIRPLWLLSLDRLLQDNTDVIQFAAKIIGKEFSTGVSLSPALGVRFVRHHRRVLDAWVHIHVEAARVRFCELTTVRERMIHVSTRVRRAIDAETIDNPTVEHFRGTFESPKTCVVIIGEGGTGKTTLALQIAHWAMAADSAKRLCRSHVMIPVLIEGILDPADNPRDRFLSTVRRKLRDVCGLTEAVPPALAEQLLLQRRVLLILDGLSEMPLESRNAIGLVSASFPANAVVATTRRLSEGAELVHSPVEVSSLTGADVQRFLQQYLKKIAPRKIKASVLAKEAGRLMEAMGERPVPALIVRYFADLLVKQAMKGRPPFTVLGGYDVFRQHIVDKNDEIESAERLLAGNDIIECLERMAWECVQHGFRPFPVTRKKAVELAGTEQILVYLIDRLNVLQTTGDDNLISFVMDPIGEYFAAMHHVRSLGNSSGKWNAFFTKVDSIDHASKTARGFLIAVQDACSQPGFSAKLPDFVVKELTKRSGGSEPPS